MATPDEIREQVSNDILDGSTKIQIGDRLVEKMSPTERLAAAKEIAASEKSPFIKVGFKARSF